MVTCQAPCSSEKYPRDNMGTLWSIIYKFHKDSFPNLLKLAAVALTLPIHTADCERGFSLQNNLKNCQRNRLLPERLDTLMVILAEGPPLQEFQVAYYSFSETQLRARNTLRHHREIAENISEIWLVEIARGVLLAFFIMNGRSLEEDSERYRYKISVKPRQKPRGVVVKILTFIAHAILRYFSARFSCTHAHFCSRRRSPIDKILAKSVRKIFRNSQKSENSRFSSLAKTLPYRFSFSFA